MDIANPPETERVWLAALETENAKGVANLKNMTGAVAGRPLTPEEIVAALNYLHVLDQYFSGYTPTAQALAGLGLPSLGQRLAQVQQSLHDSIEVFGNMYRNEIASRSNWQQMQADAALAVTQSMMQTNMHTQAVYDQMNREQALINEGVPYAQAIVLSRMPT
jgi:hypothetical protein